MSARVVYKHPFRGDTQIEVVAGDPQRIVLFDMQNNDFCMWLEQYPEYDKRKATFRIFATGEPIPDRAFWVGSCITHNGAGVWHLYQIDSWEPAQ